MSLDRHSTIILVGGQISMDFWSPRSNSFHGLSTSKANNHNWLTLNQIQSCMAYWSQLV